MGPEEKRPQGPASTGGLKVVWVPLRRCPALPSYYMEVTMRFFLIGFAVAFIFNRIRRGGRDA